MRRHTVLAALLLLPWQPLPAIAQTPQAKTPANQAPAQISAKKPPIPYGAPTRLSAIALLSAGIDYTRPGIAAKLARDGEGDVVGWDAIDQDARPFLRDGPATRLVEISPTLIAPFRLDLASAASWERVLAVLTRTPARVAVVAASPSQLSPTRSTGPWDAPFATRPEILFIVPADVGATVPTMAANVLVVATLPADAASGADLVLAPAAAVREAPLGSTMPTTAPEAAILLPGVFLCIDLRGATSAAEVKKLLIAKAAKGPPGSPPLLGLCR